MPTWWRNAKPGEKLIAALTVVLIIIGTPAALIAIGSSGASSGGGGGGGGGTSGSGTSSGGTSSGGGGGDGGGGGGGPVGPAYLKELKPTGDHPTGGDVKLNGRDYPNSIFYENTEATSTASRCEQLTPPCRATSYALEGKYETFTATFGVTKLEGEIPGQWHWQVFVENEVAKQGMVPAGTTEVLSIPLKKKSVLELVVSGGQYQEHTFIWGNARVE